MGKSAEKPAEGKEVGVVNPSEEFPTGEKVEESTQVSVPLDEEETAEVDEAAGTEEEEGTAIPDEVTDDEDEISKKIDALHTAVKETLEKSHDETAKKVEALEKKIDEATQSFADKASELEKNINSFGEKIEAQKARLSNMEGRLNKMNASDAFKKSADLEESVEKSVQTDTSWNGAFSGGTTGFSVDNLT